MKKVLLIGLMLPCIAFGGVQIPEGSVKQESCGFIEQDFSNHTVKLEAANPYSRTETVKNKIAPIGKNISFGDAIFFANIAIENTSKPTYYTATSEIAVKGLAFFSVDSTIKKGQKLLRWGSVTSKDGQTKYDILLLDSYQGTNTYVGIRENGFLCSGQINSYSDGVLTSKEHDVYQTDPLVKSEVTERLSSSEEAIAITLLNMDDFSATLGVKQLKGGKVVQQKEIQLDVMSGYFQIEGLKVVFAKVDKSTLKIQSIEEPSSYSSWLINIHSKIFQPLK